MSIVVFDIGQVLVPEGDRIERLRAFLEQRGIELGGDELARGYWQYRDEYDLGMPHSEYWPKVLAAAGVESTALTDSDCEELGALDGARNSLIASDTEQLLQDLTQAGHNVALLSNAPTSMVRAVRESSWGREIEVMIFSSEVNVAKPEQAIFEKAEEVLSQHFADYQRDQTFFFDDRPVNVDGARKFGWRAYVWDGADVVRALLF